MQYMCIHNPDHYVISVMMLLARAPNNSHFLCVNLYTCSGKRAAKRLCKEDVERLIVHLTLTAVLVREVAGDSSLVGAGG